MLSGSTLNLKFRQRVGQQGDRTGESEGIPVLKHKSLALFSRQLAAINLL